MLQSEHRENETAKKSTTSAAAATGTQANERVAQNDKGQSTQNAFANKNQTAKQAKHLAVACVPPSDCQCDLIRMKISRARLERQKPNSKDPSQIHHGACHLHHTETHFVTV